MAKRTFHLSDAAARALLAAELSTSDAAFRTRLQAGSASRWQFPLAQITIICSCPRSTLMLWCRLYREGGIAALQDHRVGGNSAKLTPKQLTGLSAKLRLYTPRSLFGADTATTDGQAWTLPDLRRAVQFWYGLSYKSVASYYTLFARCDYTFHQPTKVFKSRNEAAVMQFETLLEKN